MVRSPALAAASRRRADRLVGVVALLLAAVGCQPDDPVVPSAPPPPPPPPTCTIRSVTVSPTEVSLRRGGTQSFGYSVDASNCGALNATWRSASTAIVTVSSGGVITAVGAGTTTVFADVTSGNGFASGSARVTVQPDPIIVPAPVASVSITPSTLSLTVGQSSGLTATPFDANGNPLAGRLALWSSSSTSIATVTSNGTGSAVVMAVGAGTATITGTIDGRSVSVPVIVQPNMRTVSVSLTNALLYAIVVDINGVVQGSIPAQTTRTVQVPVAPGTRLSWTLVRPVVGSREIGDPMSGFWDLSNATSGFALTIDNIVGGTPYFVPSVNNATGVTLLMSVNWGLMSENRCNCTVPVNGQRVLLGYYRLFSNSNVTAHRDGSGYLGAYRFFFDFANSVQRGSGRLEFTFTIAP